MHDRRKKPKICPICKKEFVTKLPNRKYCSMACYNENRRIYQLKLWKKKFEELKRKVEMLIGNSCVVCGSQKNICFHEINGKNHYTSNFKRHYSYILENSQDFIPICNRHHLAIHQLARTLHSETELTKATQIAEKIIRKPYKRV